MHEGVFLYFFPIRRGTSGVSSGRADNDLALPGVKATAHPGGGVMVARLFSSGGFPPSGPAWDSPVRIPAGPIPWRESTPRESASETEPPPPRDDEPNEDARQGFPG